MAIIRSTKDLGLAMRMMRKKLQLTQAQLALASGVGLRFIVELEAGKKTLQLARVLRVIDALGGEIDLVWFPMTEDEASHGS